MVHMVPSFNFLGMLLHEGQLNVHLKVLSIKLLALMVNTKN